MKTKLLLLVALAGLPAGAIAEDSWLLNGNSAIAGTNFLGTTDNLPLEFRVNNARVLRLEPNSDSPNLIGGYSGNIVVGSAGAIINGGGRSGATNQISQAPYAIIGGGSGNTIQAGALYSIIVGGGGNIIQTNAEGSIIGGGGENKIAAFGSTICGGSRNTIQTNAHDSIIGGGYGNTLQAGVYYSAIGGGYYNTVHADSYFSTIGGGDSNTVQTNALAATISGGERNMIYAGAALSIIAGGQYNEIYAYRSVIGGGTENRIGVAGQASRGTHSTISGGIANTTLGEFEAIGGGRENMIGTGSYCTIAGGFGNTNIGSTATIGGGERNTASGEYAVVAGGTANTATGRKAIIPGGEGNLAVGDYSLAAGRMAQANHHGTFVWNDATGAPFASTAENQFLIRAAGGVGIGTATIPPQTSLHVAGNSVFANRVGIGVNAPSAELDVAGKVKCQVLELAGADLAEKFDIVGQAAPGMVVCAHPEQDGQLRVSTQEYDESLIGVVSGAGGVSAGILLGQSGTLADGSQAVAMTGRAYVWADAVFGEIKPGAVLTTSPTPGHVMKVSDKSRAIGAVLGTALSSLKEGKGLVLVAIQRR